MKEQIRKVALAAVGAGDLALEKARRVAERGREVTERGRKDAESLLEGLAGRGERVVKGIRGPKAARKPGGAARTARAKKAS